MRAASGFDGGESVDVMSAPVFTDAQIAQHRGRIMARLRLEGWSYVAIGKLFRCTDRWVREEIRDVPGEQQRLILRSVRRLEDDSDDEDEEIPLAI